MDNDKARDVPLADDLADRCSLEGAELDQRLAEIEQLTRWALKDRGDEAGKTTTTDPCSRHTRAVAGAANYKRRARSP